jgi:L-lactate dehydrogenase complex protein LldG
MDRHDERRQFLSRLSKRLGGSRSGLLSPPEWPGNGADDDPEEVRVERFVDNLSRLGGRAVRVRGLEELQRHIGEEIDRGRLSPLILWKDPLLEEVAAGLPGVERIVWDPDRDPAEQIRAAERAQAGLVRAEWGVALTGSVILWNSGGRGRSVSLLPPAVFVLLERGRIVSHPRSVWTWIGEQSRAGGVPACVNWITGPSRSADIEMDLSIGVHGPGRVVVYLCERENP